MSHLFISLQRIILWMFFSIALFFFMPINANAQGGQSAIYYYYTSSGQIIAVVCYFYPGGGGYCTTDTGAVRAALAASGSGGPIGCGNCQPTDFVLSPYDLENLATPLPIVNTVKTPVANFVAGTMTNMTNTVKSPNLLTNYSLKRGAQIQQVQQVQHVGQNMLPSHVGLSVNTSFNQELLQSGVQHKQFR